MSRSSRKWKFVCYIYYVRESLRDVRGISNPFGTDFYTIMSPLCTTHLYIAQAVAILASSTSHKGKEDGSGMAIHAPAARRIAIAIYFSHFHLPLYSYQGNDPQAQQNLRGLTRTEGFDKAFQAEVRSCQHVVPDDRRQKIGLPIRVTLTFHWWGTTRFQSFLR